MTAAGPLPVACWTCSSGCGPIRRCISVWLNGDQTEPYDDAHAHVLFSQCQDTLERLRRRTVSRGTSFALTHLLERLQQTLARIEVLLDTLTSRDREQFNATVTDLFKALVRASNERNSIVVLWRQNSPLLARSITENASDHGDHYATRDRSGYLQMLRAGAAGGGVSALMALLKLQIVQQGLGAAEDQEHGSQPPSR